MSLVTIYQCKKCRFKTRNVSFMKKHSYNGEKRISNTCLRCHRDYHKQYYRCKKYNILKIDILIIIRIGMSIYIKDKYLLAKTCKYFMNIFKSDYDIYLKYLKHLKTKNNYNIKPLNRTLISCV